MELSQRIKAARLEAGLSQRQLCAGVITRNMLSQIENGAARPSMDTLSHIARQLGKPVSFFLEENAVTSPNQEVMVKARGAYSNGDYQRVRTVFDDYRQPDGTFDWERSYLLVLSSLKLAEQALTENRIPYARRLLEEMAAEGEKTPYYTAALEEKRQLLLAQTGADSVLPNVDSVLLCRAEEALGQQEYEKAGIYLDACEEKSPLWHLLRGKVFFGQKKWFPAVTHLQAAEEAYPQDAIPLLEQCFSALEDYKMAYFYACKQKK